MAKSRDELDVLILGNHPAAYLAALLLAEKPKLRIALAPLPDDRSPDRLCLLNPEFFSLHSSLQPLKKKLALNSVWGVEFLADDVPTRAAHRGKASLACVISYAALTEALRKVASKSSVTLLDASSEPTVVGVDETGAHLNIDGKTWRTRGMIVSERMSAPNRRILGIDEVASDSLLLKRYTFARMTGVDWVRNEPKPLVQMSLDLGGTMQWAWLIAGKGEVQIAVETTAGREDGREQLRRWAQLLQRHGCTRSAEVPDSQIQSFDAHFSGALEREGVANRTLLIGPAGGYFSATGEDIYPNCWSAVFAAETMTKALKERYLQDALQFHRQRWGATLGDYLRGPQQNLRFLMTMIYRNPAMTERMSESILLGTPVVR